MVLNIRMIGLIWYSCSDTHPSGTQDDATLSLSKTCEVSFRVLTEINCADPPSYHLKPTKNLLEDQSFKNDNFIQWRTTYSFVRLPFTSMFVERMEVFLNNFSVLPKQCLQISRFCKMLTSVNSRTTKDYLACWVCFGSLSSWAIQW